MVPETINGHISGHRTLIAYVQSDTDGLRQVTEMELKDEFLLRSLVEEDRELFLKGYRGNSSCKKLGIYTSRQKLKAAATNKIRQRAIDNNTLVIVFASLSSRSLRHIGTLSIMHK